MKNPELDDLLTRFAAEGLDEAEEARLAQLLTADPQARANLVAEWNFDATLVAELRARRQAKASTRRRLGPRSRPLRVRPSPFRQWGTGLAAAAALIIAVTLGWQFNRGAPVPAEFWHLSAGQVEVAGIAVPLGATLAVEVPFLVTQSGATLTHADGSTITLASAAVVRPTAHGVHLDLGRAECAIVPQQAPPFTVATVHGTVAVVGTQFTVQAEAQTAVVQVTVGVVAVTDVAQRRVLLHAREQTILGPHQQPVVQRWWRDTERMAVVVGLANPPVVEDRAIISRLEKLGFTVRIAVAETAPRTVLDEARLCVISSSCPLQTIIDRWQNLPCGAVITEIGALPAYGLAGPDMVTSVPGTTESFVPVGPAHPLHLGRSTLGAFSTAPQQVFTFNTVSVAQSGWALSTDATRTVATAVDAGVVLTDHRPAPARRVGLGLRTGGMAQITREGEEFLDAALLWAAGLK